MVDLVDEIERILIMEDLLFIADDEKLIRFEFTGRWMNVNIWDGSNVRIDTMFEITFNYYLMKRRDGVVEDVLQKCTKFVSADRLEIVYTSESSIDHDELWKCINKAILPEEE